MWWKKNKWKVIVPVVVAAILAGVFWYGGSAPGLQGWTVEKPPTEEQQTDIEYYMSMLEQTPGEEQKAYYDKKIHYTITAASGNRFIIDNLQALTEVMDVFIKDMRAKILSDGSNSEGLMSAHRQMVEALREKDESKGLKALKAHFEYIYAYIDG